MEEKEFTAQDMIDFARWFAEGVDEVNLDEFREEQKRRENEEYQRYLELKAKYEK